MVWAAVAAFFLVGLCFAIPQQLGVITAAPRWQTGAPWRVPAMLVLSVLLLVGPFYLAGAFLWACWRFAARRLPNGAPSHS
jgi:hypothetical protein